MPSLLVLAVLLFAAVPAFAAPAGLADHLGALSERPGVAMNAEIGGLARSIGGAPGSPLSAALAQAVGAQLPAGFDAELKAALASGDADRVQAAEQALEAAVDAARPGVEAAVRGFVDELKARAAKGDFTRKRLRAAAAAVAPLGAWSDSVADRATLLRGLADAATLDAARRWAKGLSAEPSGEETSAVAVPVSAEQAHAQAIESSFERESYPYTIMGNLKDDLAGTRSSGAPDTEAVMLYAEADNAILASVGPKGNGDGVTLTWSGPTAALPDGGSAPVWQGAILDLPLALAQRGWDVTRIGPLRWHVGKRSIEPKNAVVKALRGGLRLAAPANEAVTPEKRKAEYAVDPEQPAVVRLKLAQPR